jgi:nicotinic acid phosphoribosyltransferase
LLSLAIASDIALLDEHLVVSLKEQDAKITTWGVGAHLMTGQDRPALGGVYKLYALRASGQAWQYRVKVSEQAIKVNTPGIPRLLASQLGHARGNDRADDPEGACGNVTFPSCSSRGGARSERCNRWCRKLTSTVSRRRRWTIC